MTLIGLLLVAVPCEATFWLAAGRADHGPVAWPGLSHVRLGSRSQTVSENPSMWPLKDRARLSSSGAVILFRRLLEHAEFGRAKRQPLSPARRGRRHDRCSPLYPWIKAAHLVAILLFVGGVLARRHPLPGPAPRLGDQAVSAAQAEISVWAGSGRRMAAVGCRQQAGKC